MGYFAEKQIEYIDYKDTDLLERFLNNSGRILGPRWTGISSKAQRALTRAIKRARFMGLLPYVKK